MSLLCSESTFHGTRYRKQLKHFVSFLEKYVYAPLHSAYIGTHQHHHHKGKPLIAPIIPCHHHYEETPLISSFDPFYQLSGYSNYPYYYHHSDHTGEYYPHHGSYEDFNGLSHYNHF